jgi:hypothetical protein
MRQQQQVCLTQVSPLQHLKTWQLVCLLTNRSHLAMGGS